MYYNIQEYHIDRIGYQQINTMHKPLSIPDQQKIATLTQQIKSLYKELKSCELKPIQSTIIWSLKPKCEQILQLLSRGEQISQYMIKKKQILDIRKKIQEVQNKLHDQQENNPQIGHGGRMNKLVQKNYTQEELEAELEGFQSRISEKLNQIELPKEEHFRRNVMNGEQLRDSLEIYQKQLHRNSVKLLRDITIQEMDMNELKYTKEELDQILKRLENNQQVMKNIESIVISQGNNLDKVQENLEHVYTNVQEMNVHLGEAEKQQIKAINKVRAGIQKCAMGFWGFISWPFKKIFKKRKAKQTQTPTATPTARSN